MSSYDSPLVTFYGANMLCFLSDLSNNKSHYSVPKAAQISELSLRCIWEQAPWGVNSEGILTHLPLEISEKIREGVKRGIKIRFHDLSHETRML